MIYKHIKTFFLFPYTVFPIPFFKTLFKFSILSFLIPGYILFNGVAFAAPLVKMHDHLSVDTPKTQGPLVIHKIVLTGNKITKAHIILRELQFKTGDTIAAEKLPQLMEQSRKNLLNTSLFNFVTIRNTVDSTGETNITIDVIERWYVWPMPFLQLSDRNFNVWWKTKDLSKIDYGLYLTWDNFRGRKESLVVLLRHGFNQTYGLAYKVPYVNKSKTLGFGFSVGFSGNHEVAYETDENKQVYYKSKDAYVKENIFSTAGITYRRNIFNAHTFQVNYNNYHFADTLLQLNPDFTNKAHTEFLTFYYLFKSDHRDISAYPLTGYYIDVEAEKLGFGLLKNEKIDFAFVHTSLRKFWKLHKHWYFAGGINAKISAGGFQPYFIEKGIGYGNDMARSYELYVVDGQNYGLLKTNLKYELVGTRVKDFKFIPWKKFSMLHYAVYLNLNGDAAYVSDRQDGANNDLTNLLLYGGGLGIDFVTYYDKVLRIEYSVNKKGESGFFLHFTAAI